MYAPQRLRHYAAIPSHMLHPNSVASTSHSVQSAIKFEYYKPKDNKEELIPNYSAFVLNNIPKRMRQIEEPILELLLHLS